jgi:hypothetical protein
MVGTIAGVPTWGIGVDGVVAVAAAVGLPIALHTSERMVEVLPPLVEAEVSTIWPRWFVLGVT